MTEAAPTEPLEAGQSAVDGQQLKPCAKAFSSLLMGIFGCILGVVAFVGVEMDPGKPEGLNLTGGYSETMAALPEDVKQRGIRRFIASFGQWFGFVGAALGLYGLIQGITHLYQASIQLVIPKRGLAGAGSFFSLIACFSIIFAAKHGYNAHVGLLVDETQEATNRIAQVANIMQQAQDIAEGKAPPQGGIDVQAMGIGESALGGFLNPVTQIWTQDYLKRHAPNVELYSTDGRGYSLDKSKNTRVMLVLIKSASPGCRNAVPLLNQLDNEFSLGDLRILAVSQEPRVNIEAFVKQTGARFPVGKAAVMPAEPYGDVQSFPTYFILDREGVIERILIGPQPIGVLRAAAKGP